MSKEQFLIQLKRSLSGIPEAEKKDILYDYEEHFNVGLEQGKSEEEIARSLGNPRLLGKSYKIDSILDSGKAKGRPVSRAGAIFRALLATLSLGFFNVVFVLGPFAGLVGILVGLWATAGALALSGVGVLIGLIVQPFLPWAFALVAVEVIFAVLASIGISALGLLSCIGMIQVTKWFWLGIERYVKFNIRIIKK